MPQIQIRRPTPPRLQEDLVNIAWALNLFRLANNVIGVFIPLVILLSGGELWQVAAFYFVYAVLKLGLNYPTMLFIHEKGAHLGLAMGFLSGILQSIAILGYANSGDVLFLVAAAACLSLSNAFCWNAQHLFVSNVIDHTKSNSNIAYVEIIGKASDFVGPLIGGVIGTMFGVTWLALTAVVIAAASIVPLLRMRHKVRTLDTSSTLVYNLSGAPKRDLFANFCFNIETLIGAMFWPIYLATVLKQFDTVGVVTALGGLTSILLLGLAGKKGDSGKSRQVLTEGVGVASIINIVRIFSVSVLAISLVSIVYKSALAYFQNAWVSTYYYHAKQRGSQYIISMEIACDAAYVAAWGILLLVLVLTSNPAYFFTVGFIIAAVAAWGCLFITPITRNRTETIR